MSNIRVVFFPLASNKPPEGRSFNLIAQKYININPIKKLGVATRINENALLAWSLKLLGLDAENIPNGMEINKERISEEPANRAVIPILSKII